MNRSSSQVTLTSIDRLHLEPSYCDRVALVIRAEHRQSGVKVAIANSHLTVAHARIRRPADDLGAHVIPKLFVRTLSHHAQHLAAATDGSEKAIAAGTTVEHRQAMLVRHQVILFHRLVYRRRAFDEVRLSGRWQTRVCVNGERAVEGLRVSNREQLWPPA